MSGRRTRLPSRSEGPVALSPVRRDHAQWRTCPCVEALACLGVPVRPDAPAHTPPGRKMKAGLRVYPNPQKHPPRPSKSKTETPLPPLAFSSSRAYTHRMSFGSGSGSPSSAPSSASRLRPPVAASPPIDRIAALDEARSVSTDLAQLPSNAILRPDDASLDPLITALYLKLATSSRDDDIRLRATHDLAEMRGHFARARVRAETAGAAVEAALVVRPELFAKLVQGLGDLGLVAHDAADAVSALASGEASS